MNVAFFTELVEKKSDDPQISDFLKMLCRRLNRRIILCYLCGNKRITEREVKMEIIEQLRPFVVKAIQQIEKFCYIPDENGHAIAFMGIQGDKLEMLFVHSLCQARRVGKQLVEYAK